MTVQAINNNYHIPQNASEDKKKWQILALLALIREVLTEGQVKLADSIGEFTKVSAQIQNKLTNEWTEVLSLQKKSIKANQIAGIVGGISSSLFFLSLMPIPVPVFIPIFLRGVAILGETVSSGFQMKKGVTQSEIAKKEFDNSMDEALLDTIKQVRDGEASSRQHETVRSKVEIQVKITEIIRAIYISMQDAIGRN